MKKQKQKITEEDKMVKKFKNYNEAVMILEAFILVAIICLIIVGVSEFINCNFDIFALKDKLLFFFGYDGNGLEILYIIENISKVLFIAVILDCLRRMMKDTYQNKTPFLKENITRMNIIAVCSIFYSEQLIYFIIVLAVKELFKYGHKLQKESDETL